MLVLLVTSCSVQGPGPSVWTEERPPFSTTLYPFNAVTHSDTESGISGCSDFYEIFETTSTDSSISHVHLLGISYYKVVQCRCRIVPNSILIVKCWTA